MQPAGLHIVAHAANQLHVMDMAEMDEVFKALADPSRRLLLDSLNARNGQNLQELCAGLSMARQSVSKHLAVLEAANLVTTVWRGREKLHYLNAEPINAIADRWINQYDRARVQTLADLKTALETESMSSSWGIRLHHLHPDHAGAAVAGDHRPRVLPPVHGPRDGVRLEEGLHVRVGRSRAEDRAPRAGHPRVGPVPPARVHLPHLRSRTRNGRRTTRRADRRRPAQPNGGRRCRSTSNRKASRSS